MEYHDEAAHELLRNDEIPHDLVADDQWPQELVRNGEKHQELPGGDGIPQQMLRNAIVELSDTFQDWKRAFVDLLDAVLNPIKTIPPLILVFFREWRTALLVSIIACWNLLAASVAVAFAALKVFALYCWHTLIAYIKQAFAAFNLAGLHCWHVVVTFVNRAFARSYNSVLVRTTLYYVTCLIDTQHLERFGFCRITGTFRSCYLSFHWVVLGVLVMFRVRDICHAILQVVNQVRNVLSPRIIRGMIFALVFLLIYLLSNSEADPSGTIEVPQYTASKIIDTFHRPASNIDACILMLIFPYIEYAAYAVLMLGNFCTWLCEQLLDFHDMMADIICGGKDTRWTVLSLCIVSSLSILCVAATLYAVIRLCYAFAKHIGVWGFGKLGAGEMRPTQQDDAAEEPGNLGHAAASISSNNADMPNKDDAADTVVTDAFGSVEQKQKRLAKETNSGSAKLCLSKVTPALSPLQSVEVEHKTIQRENKTAPRSDAHSSKVKKLGDRLVKSAQPALEHAGENSPFQTINVEDHTTVKPAVHRSTTNKSIEHPLQVAPPASEEVTKDLRPSLSARLTNPVQPSLDTGVEGDRGTVRETNTPDLSQSANFAERLVQTAQPALKEASEASRPRSSTGLVDAAKSPLQKDNIKDDQQLNSEIETLTEGLLQFVNIETNTTQCPGSHRFKTNDVIKRPMQATQPALERENLESLQSSSSTNLTKPAESPLADTRIKERSLVNATETPALTDGHQSKINKLVQRQMQAAQPTLGEASEAPRPSSSASLNKPAKLSLDTESELDEELLSETNTGDTETDEAMQDESNSTKQKRRNQKRRAVKLTKKLAEKAAKEEQTKLVQNGLDWEGKDPKEQDHDAKDQDERAQIWRTVDGNEHDVKDHASEEQEIETLVTVEDLMGLEDNE